MTSGTLVLVGASGWLHPAWRGGFYPDGLPDDWLLSYYNTQFQAVYLPAPVWQAASEATWEQWLNDTQDGFHFVLEPGDAAFGPTRFGAGIAGNADVGSRTTSGGWTKRRTCASWHNASPSRQRRASRCS